ncbi:MAG: hypothetical protein DRR16_22070 [Candidatus Parabeggiatoa sp. nov. 3]|nr:MAG: hypothetical protein DRR00_13970 [Gammaproteobacteria bacterium]RKZ66267.1 MAG: hypothetical protein DRQ99_10185 [Gammaproteobacteria bacterium]RKZ81494.1 MAG: hypothetical protein DRR16_22070 [Gammaproteobacteria bacterium]
MQTDNMQIDLAGRVKNTNLSPSKALWPLFEAITNSIHAIEDAGIKKGRIHLMIERDNTQQSLKGSDFAPIKTILIEDNGIGFNDNNLNSFRTSDSTFKAKRGGKGIGRLLWLKVFEHVQIDSVFQQNEVFYQRCFEFSLTKQGISDLEENQTDKTERKTIVKLSQFKEPYQKKCPKSLEKIALRIIEHFLIYFMFDHCSIILQDNDDNTLILNELYQERIRPYTEKGSFQLKNETFEIMTLRFYESSINESQVHLCAYQRDVWAERIDKYLPDLGNRIEDQTSGKKFILLAYIESHYLDQHVNAERTDFNIDDEESLFVSKSEVIEMAMSHIKEQMKTYLDAINATKKQRVENYVQKEAPRYRHILKHRAECLHTIPLKLLDKPQSMDLELYKVSVQLELELMEKGKRFLTTKIEDIKDLPQYQAEYNKYLEQENELSKAKLAEYVAHRDIILKLLESHLKQSDNGKYSKEKSLHSLIFPVGQTSDDIAYDDHHLWIIDERLSYHKYLASDKALNRLEPIVLNDKKRPDIIVFNSPLVFVEEESRPFSSIVIIEFKRPMRQDSDDPVEQVYGYINKIRNEDVTDKEGMLISVRENTPFYCYIICSLTKKMRNLFELKDFTKSPDELGYFYYHKNLKAYIEVISYEKLLKDAKERNRVLFDKLNLPR